MKTANYTQAEETVAALNPPIGTNQNVSGHWFLGAHGILGVALRPGDIAKVRQEVTPSHWVIPVNSMAMVQAAQKLYGEIFWLCPKDPAEVVGHLQEDIRGAWLNGNKLVVNLHGMPVSWTLEDAPPKETAIEFLASIVVDCWTGALPLAPLSPAFSNSNNSLLCAA